MRETSIMPIGFQFDMDKTREAIAFLVSASEGGLDVYKVCKLLFLADKHHLVRYGRPITGDWYFALPHGPAPSRSLRLLQILIEDPENAPALASILSIDRSFVNPRFSAKPMAFDNLSQSDVEALTETLKRFSAKEFSELRAMTHETKAYQNAWGRRGTANSAKMAFEDFFEEDSDAIAGVLEEAIEDSNLRKVCARR
jgi:uncharacterized phage-associated protein